MEGHQPRLPAGSGDRRLKLLSHVSILAGVSSKYDPEVLPPEDLRLADTLEDEAATKQFVRWIHQSEMITSEETNRDYRVALRMFGEHVTDGEGKPDSIDIVSSTTPKNYKPRPDPAKMYWWEDHIEPMLDASKNYRDQAAIAVASQRPCSP